MGIDATSGSPCFHPGERYRIAEGQFQGYEVEVVGVDEPARAVWVSMLVFGRPVWLSFLFEMAAELLEPLPRGNLSP